MTSKKWDQQSYVLSLDKEGQIDCCTKLVIFFESVITKFPNKWNFGQLSRFQIELEKVEGGN